MTITGGKFTIDSADDAVHSNANITISGGEFTISTGDDGVHADGDLTISGDKITVTKSYEGLEGNNIYITNGAVSIVASDDGINAAGGNDGSGAGGNFGGDRFASGGSHSINISGGLVITQSIASRDGDAIDTDGTVTFTGGTIIYAGTLNTGVNPSGSSTQSYVYLAASISAGDNITVKKNGNILVSYTPDANIKYLAISSPDIKSGESYEIYNGGALITTATAGTGGGGGMGGRGGMGGGGKRP